MRGLGQICLAQGPHMTWRRQFLPAGHPKLQLCRVWLGGPGCSGPHLGLISLLPGSPGLWNGKHPLVFQAGVQNQGRNLSLQYTDVGFCRRKPFQQSAPGLLGSFWGVKGVASCLVLIKIFLEAGQLQRVFLNFHFPDMSVIRNVAFLLSFTSKLK